MSYPELIPYNDLYVNAIETLNNLYKSYVNDKDEDADKKALEEKLVALEKQFCLTQTSNYFIIRVFEAEVRAYMQHTSNGYDHRWRNYHKSNRTHSFFKDDNVNGITVYMHKTSTSGIESVIQVEETRKKAQQALKINPANVRSSPKSRLPQPKSTRNTNKDDRHKIVANLRKMLNNCTSERDPFAWKNSIEKSGPYELDMIEYAPNRGAWKIVDWSLHNSVAIIKIVGKGNFPQFVVPIGFSINNPQIREWYDVEGEGHLMQINKLPTATRTNDSHEVTYTLSKEKGIINLSHT